MNLIKQSKYFFAVLFIFLLPLSSKSGVWEYLSSSAGRDYYAANVTSEDGIVTANTKIKWDNGNENSGEGLIRVHCEMKFFSTSHEKSSIGWSDWVAIRPQSIAHAYLRRYCS